MDKNMINIDDLLKQRLAHGEEKERPGAWLQMRELLDKELPVTQAPTVAYNWRRMMGYLAGLALLATVSVGGYQVATRINADGNTNEAVSQAVNGNNGGMSAKTSSNTITSSNNTSSSNNQNSNPETSNTTATIAADNNNGKDKTTTDNSVNKAQETKTAANNTLANNAHTNSNKATGSTNGVAATANDHKNSNSQKSAKNGQSAPTASTGLTASSATANATGKGQLDANSKSYNKQADNKLSVDNNTIALNNTAANNTAGSKGTPATQQQTEATQRNYGSGNNPAKSLPVKSNLQQPAVNTTAPVAKTNNSNGTPSSTGIPAASNNSNSVNTPGGNTVATNTGNKPNTANKGGQEPQTTEEKSYINKIETKEKYSRTAGWKKDTIATGKVEWPNEPMLAKAEENKADNTVVPAASMSVKNNEEHLVPLADYKVSSKQAHYEKVNHFAEMVQNAKIRMGTVRFHPGLILGANTSISSQNSLYGFQLGATGTLSLNDRWGILTELKYVQRLRKEGMMDAASLGNIDSSTINTAGQTIYKYDSTARYFNYTTISSIELPVAIKYSLKRLNLFGGGNLVYNFGINADPNDKGTVTKEALSISSTISYINGRPQIQITDFNSRFSVGYLIGAGYQLSPAVQLDVRLTQNLWDNAKTDGAKAVSKDLYKMPSIQINMSYRFSSNKNRPMKAR